MARQDTILVSGKVGDIIGYQLKGKYYVRAVPKEVRQTKETKRSAADFGRAVRISQEIRASLQPLLANHKDRPMTLRLNSAIFRWLRNSNDPRKETFIDFQFNPKLKLKFENGKILQSRLEEGVVTVSVPSLNIPGEIRFPKNTELLQLKVVAVSCDLDQLQTPNIKKQMIEIPFSAGEVSSQDLQIPFTPKTNTINVVAAGFQYFQKQNEKLKEMKENRAAIIVTAWIRQ